MNDMVKQAVWNELKITLEKWDRYTEMLASPATCHQVTPRELRITEAKIDGLIARLDKLSEVAGQ